MKGKRRDDGTLPHDLEPGEYSKAKENGTALWICCPNGDYARVIEPTWTITEHEDGTFTVDPSIRVNRVEGHTEGWHGFLERGVWRSV